MKDGNMNREIKFRAWDKKNSKWIFLLENTRYFLNLCGGSVFDNKLGEYLDTGIEQFTGLLDRNGKEIYEGDILLNEYVGGGEAYVVDFTPHWFHHEIEYGLIDKGMGHAFAVIGNIHQNPELLKV
jgi:hypothetical protein